MLELLTTEPFAEWFSALDDEAAEDVAATLEVIAQLGTRTEAPSSSEWLTWYEHPSVARRVVEMGSPPLLPAAILRFLDGWGAFNGYTRRVIKHLESPSFVARLGHLDPRDAAVVAEALARIRRYTTSRRLALWEFQRRVPLDGGPLTPENAAELARFVALAEIRESYFAALAAAGFAVADVPAHSPALREISLRSRAPGLRLLYGVDTRRNQGLVVLGEWMDRSFYGDSVRRAEQLWQQFLDGQLQVSPPPRSR